MSGEDGVSKRKDAREELEQGVFGHDAKRIAENNLSKLAGAN